MRRIYQSSVVACIVQRGNKYWKNGKDVAVGGIRPAYVQCFGHLERLGAAATAAVTSSGVPTAAVVMSL